MINKAILMGRLTRDPELRHTNSGTPVCSFSIAINNGYGENAQTDFINCVAWNKTAEFVSKYFTKGRMIIVIGRISTRSWDGPDGKKNYATEVVANEVAFGESKRDGGEPSSQSFGGASAPESIPSMPMVDDGGFSPLDTDDDLPF
ncbi:MAG: single-stranded DNA-binding protein [Clostridia bacterium]|nr:single-stranded DNA-binding protein [Clostridia bacterium]